MKFIENICTLGFIIVLLYGAYTFVKDFINYDETNPYYKAVNESRNERRQTPVLPKTITDNCGIIYTFPLKFDIKCAVGFNKFSK